MAQININNNYGTVSITEIQSGAFSSHDGEAMEAWMEMYYPGMLHPEQQAKEPAKLEESNIEKQLATLTAAVNSLVNLMTKEANHEA